MAGVTTLTPTVLTDAGVSQTLSAANSCGSKWKARYNDFVRVTNTTGTDIHIVFANQIGGSDLDITVAATTGDETIAFDEDNPIGDFMDEGGYVNFTWTGTVASNVSVGIFRMPAA
jgi:hypothetical protein